MSRFQLGMIFFALAAQMEARAASLYPTPILGAALSSAWNWLTALCIIAGVVMIVQGARKLGHGEEGVMTIIGGVIILGVGGIVKYVVQSSGGDATAGGLLP